MRKCGRGVVAELAVMEMSPAPASRTRAAKRRKAAVAAAAAATGAEGIQISYLQLRSRSLVMTQRTTRSKRNSARRRVSRCSSNASNEAAPLAPESRDAPESRACNSECSEVRDESDGVESASGRRRPERTPVENEIEAFFEEAETEELQRFAAKYNFDFVNDRPLAGRYEWVPLNP